MNFSNKYYYYKPKPLEIYTILMRKKIYHKQINNFSNVHIIKPLIKDDLFITANAVEQGCRFKHMKSFTQTFVARVTWKHAQH